MIYLGADHRGFELKEKLYKRLSDEGFEVTDLGGDHLDPGDDYVDFAFKVASSVIQLPDNKGILICGSGVGMAIAANKVKGIRCALVFDLAKAKQAREHLDANIISLPVDFLDEEAAWEIVKTFLTTAFSREERHIRRLKKIKEFEKENAV